jgi:hypothetical protein
MYVFNWKFGGLDFEVPDYISRNYDEAGLKLAVGNIAENYGKNRLTIPAQDLSGGSVHSFEAVKNMKDIAFIGDKKKIIFLGRSRAASFDYLVREDTYTDGTPHCTLEHQGRTKIRDLDKEHEIFRNGGKYVEIKHSDVNVDESCYFLGKDARTAFFITTEMFRPVDKRGYYELFDIGEDGKINYLRVNLILSGHYGRPEVGCSDGTFVLKNLPTFSGAQWVGGGVYAPAETNVDLVYDWDNIDFKETNQRTAADLGRIAIIGKPAALA